MKKLMCLVLSFVILLSTCATVHATEHSGVNQNRILYFVSTPEDRHSILNSALVSPYQTYADISVLGENYTYDPFDYGAIAIPAQFFYLLPLGDLFNSGVHIYLYGSVSPESFSSSVGINEFGVYIPIYNENDIAIGTAFQETVDNQREYEVIGLDKTQTNGLLCSIGGDTIMPYEYYNAILRNFNKSSPYASTIIRSEFDIVSYYYNSNASTHLDYQLYRDTGESDYYYDYYAIRTNVWAECEEGYGIIHTIGVQHEFIGNDQIYAHQPAAQNTNSFNVNVTLPSGPISISASFTKKMAIDVATDYTNDIVEWTMYRASPYIGSGDISLEVLTTGTSWATNQGSNPIFTVNYRSVRTNSNGTGPVNQPWESFNFGLQIL